MFAPPRFLSLPFFALPPPSAGRSGIKFSPLLFLFHCYLGIVITEHKTSFYRDSPMANALPWCCQSNLYFYANVQHEKKSETVTIGNQSNHVFMSTRLSHRLPTWLLSCNKRERTACFPTVSIWFPVSGSCFSGNQFTTHNKDDLQHSQTHMHGPPASLIVIAFVVI